MSVFVSLGRQPKFEAPYPAWDESLIGVIEAAIREATRRVMAGHSRQARLAAVENDLTHWLQEELWLLLDQSGAVPGFTHDVFDKPTRGAEVENYDGTKISKKPDLTFYRHGPTNVVDGRHDAWFCECKILDATHSLNDYIYQGLMRFVNGTYAWAMPAAQMIGYVRHSANANQGAASLPVYMNSQNPSTGKTHAHATSLLAIGRRVQVVGATPLLSTTHARGFPLRNGTAPGPIELRHLWLQMI